MVPLARVPLAGSVPQGLEPFALVATREWRVSIVSQQGSRVLVHREAPCRECEAREVRPEPLRTAPPDPLRTAAPDPLRAAAPREPRRAAAPPDGAADPVGPRHRLDVGDLGHDPLWRGFWWAIAMVLLASGLAWAAAGLGGRTSGGLAVRVVGWAALALPFGVLAAALRARGPGGRRRPDLVLVLLGVTLEASALARMHAVLGALLGFGR